MSTERSWHTIFEVEFASREPYTVEFASFEGHKTALLDILRKAHGGGAKSKPFDKQRAWRDLMIAAHWYFRRPAIKRKTLLPARRFERLQDLAKALSRARSIVNQAKLDDVAFDLFRGWWTETKRPPVWEQVADARAIDAVADEITDAVAKLAALEAAARRAAGNLTKNVGPRSGTGILSMHDIIALKGLYQRSTGLEPPMGSGPFVEFVETFLSAVGQGDKTTKDYVVEALKYAGKQARKYK
jgi:hypothetical protein